MKKFFIGMFILMTLVVSCGEEELKNDEETERPVLIQISVIDALLQGIYDGYYPINQLAEIGDVGIGTFDGLDGEMIFYNDTVFQVVSTGEVKIPANDMLTPFAAVTNWVADTTFALNNSSFNLLKSSFSRYFPTPNIFYAVKIKGEFSYMKTRSVPKQEKPYLPLSEVTKTQPEFEFHHTKGVVIGFYCPAYASGINVTGFHLHFLTDDRKGGGHILEYQLDSGTMELCYLFDYQLILPEGGDFFGGDFTVDRTDEVEETEQ
jgi:acetolactate decarboxylase